MKKIAGLMLAGFIFATIFSNFAVEISTAETYWDIEEDFTSLEAYPFQAVEDKSSPKVNFGVTASVPSTSPPWTTDATRLYRASGKPQVFLTYYLDGKDITYFKILTGTSLSSTIMRFETSTDGTTFTPIQTTDILQTQTADIATWISRDVTPVATLLPGVKYLKLVFDLGTSNTQLQLLKAYITSKVDPKLELDALIKDAEAYSTFCTSGGIVYDSDAYDTLQNEITSAKAVYADVDATEEEITVMVSTLTAALNALKDSVPAQTLPFSDDCSSFNKLWEKGLVRTADSSTAGASIADSIRIVKNIDCTASTYMTYRLKEQFNYFKINALMYKVNPSYVHKDFTFKVWDGVAAEWTDVTNLVTTKIGTDSSWAHSTYRDVIYEGYGIPEGARYLKIIFAETQANNVTYGNAISNVYVSNEIGGEGILLNRGSVRVTDNDIQVTENGSPITSSSGLATANEVTVTVDVRNNTYVKDLSGADIIAAVYDNEGVLVGCGFKSTDFGKESGNTGFEPNQVEISGIKITKTPTTPYIKIFVFDSLNNLEPLAGTASVFR